MDNGSVVRTDDGTVVRTDDGTVVRTEGLIVDLEDQNRRLNSDSDLRSQELKEISKHLL